MKDEKNEKMSLNLMDYNSYKKEWLLLQDLKAKIQNEQRELEAPSKDAIQEIEDRKQQNIDRVLLGGKPEDISYVDIYRNNLYNKTQKRIRVYRHAVTQQEKILNNVRYKISKKIVKEVKPEYEIIIKGMASAWIELGKYVIRERVLRENLNDNDVAYISDFTPMPIYGVGDPRVYNSRFSGWLIEAVERGYFKSADIPKEFKDAWEKRDGVVIDSIARGY